MKKLLNLLNLLKQELLNKEMRLIDLDNIVLDSFVIAGYGITTSLFENEYYVMQNLSVSYETVIDKSINVEFEIVKQEENNLDTIVKVIFIDTF